MSSVSILSSVESERRWVGAMEKNFPQQQSVSIDIDSPPCIFKVAEAIAEANPQAYAPRSLGMGPYHHLRPQLYAMQYRKLSAIRKFLSPQKLQSFQLLIDGLIPLEPVIRGCYDHYLDLDIQTLAWILAIDGLYLLQFLKNYPQLKYLAEEVIMLENQIPVVLLNKIREILQQDEDCSLFEEFQVLCEDLSPLELNENRAIVENINQSHLLHRMYYLIVNNRGTVADCFSAFSFNVTRIGVSDVLDGVQFLAEEGLPGAGTAGAILSFVNKIPWDKILGLFKKNGGDEQTVLAEEIDIPSVSQMSGAAGIKFVLVNGGIRDIKFEESEDENTFHLPVIRLTATSQVVLRNLVAFEAASIEAGSTRELAEYVDLMCGIVDTAMAEYVDLMCGIVDTAKDVEILKEAKIIESELSGEEIASIFNGISKSTKSGSKSNVDEAIDNVNTRYSNSTSVKVKRFLEKYVYASLKILSAAISIAVLVLLILQAYCSVFGCSQWFGKNTTQIQSLLFSIFD